MIFDFNTPSTNDTKQVIALKNHSFSQIHPVGILESNVCQEKITTFKGAQFSHNLCKTTQRLGEWGQERRKSQLR
jgi:hypothetical protein